MSIVVEYNLRRRLKDQIERMTRSDPVSQYLRDNKPLMAGESVQIPTSLRGEIVRYTVSWRADTGLSVWRTNRTMNQYKDELFSDQFERGKVNLSKGIFEVKLRANRSDVIAGGINKAFAPGKTVLDLGSAKAIALLQFFRDFPKTMFIGVDTGYDRTEAVNINNPGVQLINDNWESLITIPDHSIDTLLSCAGAFTHGVHISNQEASMRIITALNRVAKPGAILRYDTDRGWSGYNGNDDNWAVNLLRENGWVVYPSSGGTNVAIKNS